MALADEIKMLTLKLQFMEEISESRRNIISYIRQEAPSLEKMLIESEQLADGSRSLNKEQWTKLYDFVYALNPSDITQFGKIGNIKKHTDLIDDREKILKML